MTTFTTEDRILAEKDGSYTINVEGGTVTSPPHIVDSGASVMDNKPVAWMSQGGDVSRSADYFEEMGFKDLIPLYTHPVKEQDGCGNCHSCLVGVTENGYPVTFQRMILCPDCGNKRCPKASNHRHQCTESNEPNQRGSIYAHPVKELTDEEIGQIWKDCMESPYMQASNPVGFARAILRKAQEK
jgi:hypothetical protein